MLSRSVIGITTVRTDSREIFSRCIYGHAVLEPSCSQSWKMWGLKGERKDDVGEQVEAKEASIRKGEIWEEEMELETMEMGGRRKQRRTELEELGRNGCLRSDGKSIRGQWKGGERDRRTVEERGWKYISLSNWRVLSLLVPPHFFHVLCWPFLNFSSLPSQPLCSLYFSLHLSLFCFPL